MEMSSNGIQSWRATQMMLTTCMFIFLFHSSFDWLIKENEVSEQLGFQQPGQTIMVHRAPCESMCCSVNCCKCVEKGRSNMKSDSVQKQDLWAALQLVSLSFWVQAFGGPLSERLHSLLRTSAGLFTLDNKRPWEIYNSVNLEIARSGYYTVQVEKKKKKLWGDVIVLIRSFPNIIVCVQLDKKIWLY